ncbi:transposase family protein [Streptomyces sp. NPDC007095]|uniref:transposase family protein n=1 Tax=Streptomyces sp. NPDC007095 TaxID=3154482 RepID=UPI0033E99CFB
MKIEQVRATMSHPAFCGLSHQHLGELVAELAPRWVARCESVRHGRREDDRRREAGAGPKYELVFTDRLLVTLVHLRTGLTHEASGVLYEVGSPTIGQAILEVRPLLVDRGFAVPDRPGIRLRTLEDVFAYAASEDVTPWIDGMETQVRRPHAGRPGRRSGGWTSRRRRTAGRGLQRGARASRWAAAAASSATAKGRWSEATDGCSDFCRASVPGGESQPMEPVCADLSCAFPTVGGTGD